MTKKELSKALKIAQSDLNLTAHETDIFMGFGSKDFKPVYCLLNQLAWLVRYQCVQFNGGVDADALSAIAIVGKTKFMVV